MKTDIIKLLAVMLVALCSCTEVRDEPQPTDKSMLNLTVSAVGGPTRTRSEASDNISAGEMMQTLRIIILRPDGMIEHNRFLDFRQTPSEEYGDIKFEVTEGERKKIVLLANEESRFADGRLIADYDWASLATGNPYPSEADQLPIITTEATMELPLPLVMSGIHSVDVPAEGGHSVTLPVLRAAVKFSFSITNSGRESFVVKGLEIEKIARKAYLFPHGHDYTDGTATDYEVPTIGNNDHYTFTLPTDSLVIPAGSTVTLRPLYLPESRYTDPDGDARNYRISLLSDEMALRSGYFDNLSQLPRNTHAVVEVNVLNSTEAEFRVEVSAYGSHTLMPDFGL